MFMLAQLLIEGRMKERLGAKDLSIVTTGTEAFPKD